MIASYSEEFGLSNYMAWEVAEIVGICKRRGFVVPTVYQGVYNLVYRVPEAEYVFPRATSASPTDTGHTGCSLVFASTASSSPHTPFLRKRQPS